MLVLAIDAQEMGTSGCRQSGPIECLECRSRAIRCAMPLVVNGAKISDGHQILKKYNSGVWRITSWRVRLHNTFP